MAEIALAGSLPLAISIAVSVGTIVVMFMAVRKVVGK